VRAALGQRTRARLGDLDARVPDDIEQQLTPAAVLVLLERVPGYAVILTKRTTTVDHHKGEVSFAGGMCDPGDTDMWATALREAEEELGVAPADVTVLGELDQLFTVTRFQVTPIVAAIDAGYPLRPNAAEVDRVLHVPLAHLRDPAAWFEEERSWRGSSYRLRSLRWQDDIVWGATARMLQNFLAAIPGDLL
jgi:8-oxo-dGTP pyrophosphatase MutT (NUDIX family)